MKNCDSSWQENEIDKLGAALAFAYKAQNTYKEPLDLKDRVYGWKFILEDEFTVEQVLYGLKKFLKRKTVMPVPADIYNILNPDEPRVTEAQFVAAQKWQERNGYPVFSDALDVIDKYNKQENSKRDNFKIRSDQIKQIVSNNIKKIGVSNG